MPRLLGNPLRLCKLSLRFGFEASRDRLRGTYGFFLSLLARFLGLGPPGFGLRQLIARDGPVDHELSPERFHLLVGRTIERYRAQQIELGLRFLEFFCHCGSPPHVLTAGHPAPFETLPIHTGCRR